MVVDTHPGEGNPVQRRVSYRRLKEEDGREGKGDGDNLSGHHAHDGISSKAGSMRGVNGADNRARGDDTDADFAWTNNPASLWHEIWLAFRDGMWYVLLTTIVGAAFSFFAVVHLSSHESGTGAEETPRLPARRIPSAEEQAFLHDSWMYGATTIRIGEMRGEAKRPIVLQGATAAPKEGHMRLPDQFYQGLHFGLAAWDEWGEKLDDEENRRRSDELRESLGGLNPQPSAIYPTTFEGDVEGFTVAFSAVSLGKQAKRSVRERSDPVWAEAEGAVLKLAVMKWHPKVWGPGHEDDENLHTSVLQEVLPTRTGLRKLGSTVAVYRVAKAEAPAVPSTTTTTTGATAAKTTRKTAKVDLVVSHPPGIP
eukprot:g13102.t1